jgi:aspartokinase-like uncharacterized kinase
MIIIKIGGSLETAKTLLHCLNRIEQHYQHQRVVIVVGGGIFAEQVRITQQHWQFNDECAHAMAILAMQQMAYLVKGLKANVELAHSVHAITKSSSNSIVWSPNLDELNNAGIPATWDITSDSLAAWLANTLLADELILIKSAEINAQLSLPQLAEQGIIDKAFCDSVANSAFTIRVINQQDF